MTKARLEELVKEAAEYREYPTSFICLAFVFAGHGSNNTIESQDEESITIEQWNPA